jgi:WhiB family transcriptional regulator, redox-sensing transcriptional regulator
LFEEDLGPEAWRYRAKCRGMNTDLWFPPRDKDQYKTIADAAKAICYGKDGLPECPVRKQCLLYAEHNEDTHGIWGGMSHRERNALKRKAQKQGLTFDEWIETKTTW